MNTYSASDFPQIAPICVVRQVSDLVPYERNARTHNEAQVAQIAASIAELGFTNPVLIDENSMIIAGEGRVLAAKKLKLRAVPCIVLTGLTNAQKAAYVIADNKLALNAGWDTDMLASELAAISKMDLGLNWTGFNEVEVMLLLKDIDTDLAAVLPPTTFEGDDAPPPATTPTGTTTPPETQNEWAGCLTFTSRMTSRTDPLWCT